MKIRKYCVGGMLAIITLAFTACDKSGGTNKDNGSKSGDIIVSSSGIELAWIPAGTFIMGSPKGTGYDNERPQRQVTLVGFYMGKYEVTQAQYQAVIETNPSWFSSDPASGETQNKRPVETVSWHDALVFCNKLSILEGLTPAYSKDGKTNPAEWGTVPAAGDAAWNAVVIAPNSNGYRLPTEAQWEYACRTGTTTAYNTGDTTNDNTGWYDTNSENKTHEAGKKSPNKWGLYDMYGNVSEWCWDWYGDYPNKEQNDPTGASLGSYRIVRGGGWYESVKFANSAYRVCNTPSSRDGGLGFRLARP